MAAALVVGALVTADVLSRGWLERMDLRVSDVIGGWGLRDSAAFPVVWLVTQLGGRVTILVVLAVLVGYLAWRRHTWLPLVRVLVALGLLTVVVYAIKHGTGRTAPGFPGDYFFHSDGASFPSGHVANAVLMWGIARWQAVEYGLPARVQRAFWLRWRRRARSRRASPWSRWTSTGSPTPWSGACVGHPAAWAWFTHSTQSFCHAGYVPEQAGRPRSGSRGRLLASGGALGAALVLGCPLPASAEAAGPAVQCQITDPRLPELSGLVVGRRPAGRDQRRRRPA